MLNEKLSEDVNWKDRLGELNSLPDEIPFRKSEAWEQLHQRLQGNRFKVKPFWVWIAAAAMLTIVIIPFRTYKAPHAIVKNGYPLPGVPFIARQPASRPNLQTPVKAMSSTAKNHPVKIHVTKPQPANALSEHLVKREPEKASPVAPSEDPEPVMPITITDTVRNVTAAPVAKKKLRVIHINQLGQPVEENYKESRYAGRPSPYRRFVNQNTFYTTPAANPTFTEELLKIKLTPQN